MAEALNHDPAKRGVTQAKLAVRPAEFPRKLQKRNTYPGTAGACRNIATPGAVVIIGSLRSCHEQEAIMHYAGAIKIAVVSAAVGVFLAFTLPMFETQQAQATPAIAKGKPCSTCHAGSPPSKQNLKKKK